MSTSNEKIEKVTRELGKLNSSINRDATVLLVIAVLLFAVFLGYFIYGYNKFKEISEPNLLMDVAETIVRDNITEARLQLQKEVTENADQWVQQLSDQAIDNVDDMRVELEKFVEIQIQEKIAESVELADPEFEKIMAKNNEVLRKAFQDFAKDEKTMEELVAILSQEVDQRLQTNLQQDAGEVLSMMTNLQTKLAKLRDGKDLTPEEALERQILTTARLIQQKKVDQ